jgi:speckle-type POZ protein
VVLPADRHRYIGALLDSKVGGDVTFEVGSELFTAHRYVLAARSSVFMAELFGPMKEVTTGARVPIHDMEARVFEVFPLPEMDDVGDDNNAVMAQHLFVAADRYNMERLRFICEDMLRSCVDASTVATTLVVAEQHGYHGLKEACFKFLKCDKGNLEALMASASFQHLKSCCPSLLEELLAKVAL